MIYVHSLGRASRYYPERKALALGGSCLSFRDLERRVTHVAAALSKQGFGVGDRLAFLLPNGPEYIELVYACSRLGIIAVPLNTRLSIVEIDRALADANPRLCTRLVAACALSANPMGARARSRAVGAVGRSASQKLL